MAFKVAVLANSFPLKVRPSRQTREEGTYVEWLERLLEERYPGEPIRIHNFGRFLGMLHHAIEAFDQTVTAVGPDVVIINYGGNECFPRYLPMWFMEFMARFRLSSNRVASFLFKATDTGHVLIMRPIIRTLRPNGWYSLAKFRRSLSRLIRMTIQETRAQVIVLNLPDIDNRVEYLITGCRRRIGQFNDEIEEICKENGATLIDLHGWIGRDFDGLLPDSFHLNAKGHRILGEWLAREIVRLREEAAARALAPAVAPPLPACRPSAATKTIWQEKARKLAVKIGTVFMQRIDSRQGKSDSV